MRDDRHPLDLPTKLTEITINAGSGESGKSTVVKQMKIIHQGGFSVEERMAYRAPIYQNLLESAQAIVFAMRKLSVQPADVQNRVRHFPFPLDTPTETTTDATDNRRANCAL